MKNILLSLVAMLGVATVAMAEDPLEISYDCMIETGWGGVAVSDLGTTVNFTNQWSEFNLTNLSDFSNYTQWQVSVTTDDADKLQVEIKYANGNDNDDDTDNDNQYPSLTGASPYTLSGTFKTTLGAVTTFGLQAKEAGATATINEVKLSSDGNTWDDFTSTGSVSWGCGAIYSFPASLTTTESYGCFVLLKDDATNVTFESGKGNTLKIEIAFESGCDPSKIYLEPNDVNGSAINGQYNHFQNQDAGNTATVTYTDTELTSSATAIYIKSDNQTIDDDNAIKITSITVTEGVDNSSNEPAATTGDLYILKDQDVDDETKDPIEGSYTYRIEMPTVDGAPEGAEVSGNAAAYTVFQALDESLTFTITVDFTNYEADDTNDYGFKFGGWANNNAGSGGWVDVYLESYGTINEDETVTYVVTLSDLIDLLGKDEIKDLGDATLWASIQFFAYGGAVITEATYSYAGGNAIKEVKSSVEAIEVARYNLAGQKLSGEQKGINIIVYSDGSSKKVLVK